jgi:LacI family transcriptional regulator
LISHHVSGVIFSPTAAGDEKIKQLVEKYERKNIPVVLADRIINDLECDYVTTDNFEAAYNLTSYLIDMGHRFIAVTLSDRFSTEAQRLAGYKKALLDHDIPLNCDLIKIHPGPFAEKPYVQIARNLLKQKNKIDAIFAGHDRIAYVIYSVAEEMGVVIPEDISLVGYDDLRPTCSHTISLTTVHQPIYEIGQESMKLIMERIRSSQQRPVKVVLKSSFIARESVAKLDLKTAWQGQPYGK